MAFTGNHHHETLIMLAHTTISTYIYCTYHEIQNFLQALVDSDPDSSIMCVFWDFDDEIE